MATPFSNTTTNNGILQQARNLARVDANQWPTQKVVNSSNNWLDFVTNYAIAADKRFRWDNTNHTKLPEGTTDLILNQTDYSFLTDEQGNTILTLTALSLINSSGIEFPLQAVDINDENFDLSTFGKSSGTPTQYDKISDNIVRLDNKPNASAVSTYDLKLRFQRTSKYYTASSTTQTSGFSPLLDRGFIIASAYDIALTLGLPNAQALALDRQREEEKVVNYFASRNEDEEAIFTPSHSDSSINTFF